MQGRNQDLNLGGGGPKHEQKKFHVTWFIKKKNHGRQKNCTLLPKYLSQEGYNMNKKS